MANAARMGPVVLGTVICRDLAQSSAAYRGWLGQMTLAQGRLSTAQALALNAPALIQARSALLGPSTHELPWLRLIEDPEASYAEPFSRTGWMALEIAVADVDELARKLVGSPFALLAPPADLDLSPSIRAMQVAGPAGEVLYMTQVKAALKPFDLPRARHFVDRLFIPVLGAPSRDKALAVYELIAQQRGIVFDTRLGAFNRCHGLPLEQRHPVAVIQLKQASMIEIDQLPSTIAELPLDTERLPGGIASVTFKVPARHPLLARAAARHLRGGAGEWIELIGDYAMFRNR